jgi:hypothetical protein
MVEGVSLPGSIWGETMDPVTSPLIHKDSGRQARIDPGEETPSIPGERSHNCSSVELTPLLYAAG